MKKIILILGIITFFGAARSSAQNRTTFGIKADANISNFILTGMPGYKSGFGAGAGFGGFVKIDFGDYFALQPELALSLQNSALEINGMKNDIRYFGMEIPVYAMGQLKLDGGDRAYIGIGPWLNLGFSARNTTEDRDLYKDFMQRGDVGAAAQIGYEFGFGMQINVSYRFGFLNRLDSPDEGAFMRNQAITLGIAYRF